MAKSKMEMICRVTVLLFTVENIGIAMAATPELQKQTAILEKPVRLKYRCNISSTSGIMLTNSDSNRSEYVLMHRDNRTDATNQNPAYAGKVELDDRCMIDGTLVFTLQNMSYSFVGKYYCYIFQNGDKILIGAIDLIAEDSGGRNMKNLIPIILPVISVIVVIIIIIILFIFCRKYKKHLMEGRGKLIYKFFNHEMQTVV